MQPAVGTVVRLTGVFLKSTGQRVGGEGTKRWPVLECDCSMCADLHYVAVEPYDAAYRAKMWSDLPEADRPRFRHVNIANLEVLGAPPKAEDYP